MFTRLNTQIVVGTMVLVLAGMFAGLLLGGGPQALSRPSAWIGLFIVGAITIIAAQLAARRIASAISKFSTAVRSMANDKHLERTERVYLGDAIEFLSASSALHEATETIGAQRRQSRDEIERLSTIIESIGDGVIAVDERYHVLLANTACGTLLQLPEPPHAGRALLELTRSRALYEAVVQTLSRPGSLTTELIVGDKPQKHLLLRATQLPGEPCPGVVVVLHDVTEVRRLENIRKEFVANVSHELKTPLASIKAYAETLRMGAINDPANNVNFVSRIEEDANRLNGLIADMLQIARIESHSQTFNIRPIEFDRLVHACARDMQARANAKQIDLRVVAPAEPVTVMADDEGLRTILANLVDNAIKYTPAGGAVTIAWSEQADAMQLTIEDTGMGIEQEHQGRIFERFFRVDRARTRDIGGTGLGLSIVKHLVQSFEGTISVISQLGRGSQFQVSLPLGRIEKVGN